MSSIKHKRNFRNCPICSSNKHRQFNAFNENDNFYVISICDNCGLVFQNLLFDKKHYHLLPCSYPKNYWSHSGKRAEYIYDFCHEYLPDKKEINILDIGAGFGGVLKSATYFVKMLTFKNIENSVGITLESNLDEIYGSILYSFDIENEESINNFIDKYPNKFDFIIMAHTLEHFIDPDIVIKKIKHLISKDGILYVEVPSLYNAEYRIKNVFVPEHLSYFTQTSLNHLMVSNGFYFHKNYLDSKIWGNIKQIYSYSPTLAKHCGYHNDDSFKVEKEYNSNKFKKIIQRLKHKIGFKYEANI